MVTNLDLDAVADATTWNDLFFLEIYWMDSEL